jgi:hypothetical protein
LSLRLVRDLFHINGLLEFNDAGQLFRITLNKAVPYVREVAVALEKLSEGVAPSEGKLSIDR